MPNITELKEICPQIRRDILRMVHANNSGHPGGSLGCTEFFVSLYFEIMNHNTKFTMDGMEEDLFFLAFYQRIIKSNLIWLIEYYRRKMFLKLLILFIVTVDKKKQ
jgi:hypothetical protein